MIELVIHIANKKVINMDEFRKAFSQLKDGKHLVTVKDMQRRSVPQNAYYWAVVVPMVRKGLYDAGFDAVRTNDDAHEVIKHIHLKKRMVSKQTGEVIDTARSTTELNMPDFNDFLEHVCRWSAEYLNVIIPSPNQQLAEFEEWTEEVEHEIKV